MKKKFLVLTLCFTLIFSSLSYEKSYADGGIISLPMLGVISSLAVGTGIVINNDDDLYDLGRMFYNWVDKHNDFTWQTINTVFSASTVLTPNKYVSVKSEFLDIVKEFFDNTFNFNNDVVVGDYTEGSFPAKINNVLVSDLVGEYSMEGDYSGGLIYGDFRFLFKEISSSRKSLYIIHEPTKKTMFIASGISVKNDFFNFELCGFDSSGLLKYKHDLLNYWIEGTFTKSFTDLIGGVASFPYQGGYTWDNVESKKENESVSLPIPGNLGQLVGQGNSDFWGNTDNLVGNGDLSIPSVDNPSIGIDGSVSFPGVSSPDVPGVGSPSVPNEGIWSTIKEFIIGLVVPSDTFWTDTWGGLYNNFTNSFPMVDVDGFNDLVTGEKKFPNIDINIMGVSGRVVNGDVINSIVEWLRPIIAGFMMLCLMLFNYRKIYKLIRNTEPFGGIAPGTSDFNTGISEYSKQEVVKATDMVAEYRAWRERGGK